MELGEDTDRGWSHSPRCDPLNNGSAPACFLDADGNPVIVDQHV